MNRGDLRYEAQAVELDSPMNDHMRSPIVRFGRWLAAVCLIAGAPVCGYFLFKLFLLARASEKWPSVPGAITRAEVVGSAFEHYSTSVTYKYVVAGRDYFGHRIRAGDGSVDDRATALRSLGDLRSGQQATVYYDPANPGESMLHPGAGFQEYALLFVPVVMFGGGVGLIVWLRRTRDLPDKGTAPLRASP